MGDSVRRLGLGFDRYPTDRGAQPLDDRAPIAYLRLSRPTA
jgi:hypothetical protein